MNKNEYFISKHGPNILLGLLIIFVVVSNWVWLQSDRSLGRDSDSKVYITKTIVQLDELMADGWPQSPADWLTGLSKGGRPPLYQIFSMPFILFFGRSMDSGLMINLVFQTLLIFFVYLIGKKVGNSRTGLLAALFVSSYPPLIQISKIYAPHFALVACVALSLWRAFEILKNRSVQNVWWFVLSLAFGILIHPKMAGGLLIPVPIFSLYVVFFQDEPRKPGSAKELAGWIWTKLSDRIVWAGFLPAILLGALPVLAWYLTVGNRVFNTFERITSEELADFRGFEILRLGFGDSPPFFWYLSSMPYALSSVLTLLFGIGFVYSVLKHDIIHVSLLVSFVGAYIVIGSYKTLAWINFSQILPIVALITAVWIGELRNKKIAWVVTSLAVIGSLAVFSIVTWGTGGFGIKVAQALSSPVTTNGSCPLNRGFCPSPPDHTDWHMSEILIAIRDDNSKDCLGLCDLLFVRRGSNFLGENLRYYWTLDSSLRSKNLAIRQLRLPLWSVTPFDFDLLLNSEYIVYITPPEKVRKGTLVSYDPIANNFLADPPLSFANAHQCVAVFDVNDDNQIQLIKRVKPLSLAEAEDTIRAIEIDEKYKYQQYAVLAPLYVQAGRFDDAQQAYSNALKYAPGNAELYFGLAGIYEATGKLEEAASAYRQVIAVAPGSKLAHQAQAWLNAH